MNWQRAATAAFFIILILLEAGMDVRVLKDACALVA